MRGVASPPNTIADDNVSRPVRTSTRYKSAKMLRVKPSELRPWDVKITLVRAPKSKESLQTTVSMSCVEVHPIVITVSSARFSAGAILHL
jgi:hypothetical protein